MSVAEIRSLLTGEPGSTVTFSVVRARRSEPQKVVVTRDIVTIPPIKDKMLEDGIAQIRVDALTKGKSQEIASRIKSLQKSGAKKLITDGPFVESKEVVGGYLIVSAASLDEATIMSKGCPILEEGGSVEVRQIHPMQM